ncbi:hypothetical protein K3495_g8707 [Podosphaera aphanis]|nr:hypothetical protein K3495_g8707 [Podosphaera aphanis]
MASGLSAAKQQLRSSMKAKLAALSPESINLQSHRIAQTVTNSLQFQIAQRIGIYLSMPCGEVQTDAIVRNALQSGKQVFVPYLVRTAAKESTSTPSIVMEMVHLISLLDYESLKRDRWGIPTIADDTAHQREWVLQSSSSAPLDMILVPGVAFELDSKTRYIKRLGHGKGFYDHFLDQYKTKFLSDTSDDSTNPKPLLYGLALEEQYLANENDSSVPTGEHDCLLHGLIVGSGKLIHAPLEMSS